MPDTNGAIHPGDIATGNRAIRLQANTELGPLMDNQPSGWTDGKDLIDALEELWIDVFGA